MVGEDDLYRVPQHLAAEVIDRHPRGRDASLPAVVGIGPRHVEQQTKLQGRLRRGGQRNAAKTAPNSKLVSRMLRLPVYHPTPCTARSSRRE